MAIETIVKVKVLPRSSRNQILGLEAGILKVKLTAPPIEGKANKALIQLLSKTIGIPKSNIEIISGERSSEKILRISGRIIEFEKII
ncbi:conserved hypothetical protein [uncultured Desulfobacterium sp.]|uniref:UPF0235 protein PITCH_A1530033 n=1 Tax=uncultured Desulfobacterium sp. TaxID=201089 RepID=A0A445MTN0_9BACT|nr:conserved hypothetical protein [uncultured Desulfobacterium sp.]